MVATLSKPQNGSSIRTVVLGIVNKDGTTIDDLVMATDDPKSRERAVPLDELVALCSDMGPDELSHILSVLFVNQPFDPLVSCELGYPVTVIDSVRRLRSIYKYTGKLVTAMKSRGMTEGSDYTVGTMYATVSLISDPYVAQYMQSTRWYIELTIEKYKRNVFDAFMSHVGFVDRYSCVLRWITVSKEKGIDFCTALNPCELVQCMSHLAPNIVARMCIIMFRTDTIDLTTWELTGKPTTILDSIMVNYGRTEYSIRLRSSMITLGFEHASVSNLCKLEVQYMRLTGRNSAYGLTHRCWCEKCDTYKTLQTLKMRMEINGDAFDDSVMLVHPACT